MMKWKVVTALAACLAAPMALAQSSVPERGPIPFSAYDRDGDGRVSQEEFYSVRGERMSQRSEEGRPMRGYKNAPTFEQIDADGDGTLSADELASAQQARRGMKGRGMGRRGMGSGMRQPRGGMMGGQQGMGQRGQGGMMGGQQGMGQRGQGGMMGGQQGMGQRGQGGMMGGQQGMGQRGRGGMQGGQQGMRGARNRPAFSEFDLNGDGQVNREEFREARRLRIEQRQREGYPMRNMGNAPDFEALDGNNDGILDEQEFGRFQGWQRNQ